MSLSYTKNVEILGKPQVARQIGVTSTASSTALSDGVFRISMYAKSGDIRFDIGQGTQYANQTCHFIAEGERLDFAVNSGDQIGVVAATGTTSAVLEVTELG
jgi:hypothetical protein